MVKRFSTVRDNQRNSQSYMKNRRGRREIEMRRRRQKGDSRGERQIYTVLCSQTVLPRHPQRFTELDWEEKEEGGNRGDLSEKTRVKSGRE